MSGAVQTPPKVTATEQWRRLDNDAHTVLPLQLSTNRDNLPRLVRYNFPQITADVPPAVLQDLLNILGIATVCNDECVALLDALDALLADESLTPRGVNERFQPLILAAEKKLGAPLDARMERGRADLITWSRPAALTSRDPGELAMRRWHVDALAALPEDRRLTAVWAAINRRVEGAGTPDDLLLVLSLLTAPEAHARALIPDFDSLLREPLRHAQDPMRYASSLSLTWALARSGHTLEVARRWVDDHKKRAAAVLATPRRRTEYP